MKQFFILLAAVGVFWACSGPKPAVVTEKAEPKTVKKIEKDSVSYVMETFDSKFEKWYNLHKSPSEFRTQEFYEKWNMKYVTEWNRKSTQKGNSDFFVPILSYDRKKDYGFPINHQLFYYFQYVENVLKVRILSNSPKVVSE